MTIALATLIVGVGCAVLGGALFVRGVVNVALWWRIPSAIVGATVAAFATSAPELSVGVNAALAGRPQIVLGDALGSNVVNIAVVLGLALVFGTLHMKRDSLSRDLPVAMISPAILGLLAFDGRVTRLDALVLMTVFVVWLTQTTLAARRHRRGSEVVPLERSHKLIFGDLVGGLLLLIAAGRLVTMAAIGIGDELGWDGFVVGVIFVALSTSTPEIATMVASRVQKQDDVGVGTLLGSNIFNTLLIVGTAALIQPINVVRTEMLIAVAASIAVVALAIPNRTSHLKRWRGVPLLVTYVVTLVVIGMIAG